MSESEKRVLLSISGASRLEYVLKVLQALHVAEFVLLIEFTEVVIPFTHCEYAYDAMSDDVLCSALTMLCVLSLSLTGIFLVASFNLSNRAYYSWFQGSSVEDVDQAMITVVLYALFEAATLVLVGWVLQRKLQISALHQVAFVLDTQWREIQSKLVLSLVFALSSTLEHFGTDYSFRFAWLHGSVQTR